ncbi:MAG: hypothetical protein NTV16_09190 [Actinobacteria bacterium]|nr:hypothetical protein [Actinomycetota bacterium]
MTGLLIFSLILITLHVFSLRAIIKTNNEETLIGNIKKVEGISSSDEKTEGVSFNLLFPVLIIVILSLIEIAYFAFAVYVIKDYVLIIGASVLTGYNLYALVRFFPKLRLFFKSPVEYFKEKTDTFDNILNFVMAVFEILFCIYVIVKIFMKYNFY